MSRSHRSHRSHRSRGTVAVVALAAALTAAPSTAASGPVTSVGTKTSYGLSKSFQLVGHADLGKRGMNSPIAVAGKCVYVGDRADKHGIAIVDVTKPAKPTQVDVIKPTAGSTQREIRADAGLGLLVVMTYSLNGIGDTKGNSLQTYDIRDCKHPKLLATVDFGARSPHEFFLWKDPKRAGRTVAFITFTLFSPDLMAYDLADPTNPKLIAAYDIGIDATSKTATVLSSGSGYLHSLSVSDDGTQAYMGNWDYGFYVADTSLVANPPGGPGTPGLVRPVGAGKIDYNHNVHGAVKVPGRPYVVMVQEEYANAGNGCPFGWLRMGDITDVSNPKVLGEFKLPENDCARAKELNGTFTAHNQTLFPDIALVPWYSGGLRAVDISDPNAPREAGAFVPKHYFDPGVRDTRLFFPGSGSDQWSGAMWSYPVVQNGLIYVVDIDLGLFILRYTGKHADEVRKAAYVEGNSSSSRYTGAAPAGHRTAAQWATIDAFERTGAVRHTAPALPAPVIKAGTRKFGFLCL